VSDNIRKAQNHGQGKKEVPRKRKPSSEKRRKKGGSNLGSENDGGHKKKENDHFPGREKKCVRKKIILICFGGETPGGSTLPPKKGAFRKGLKKLGKRRERISALEIWLCGQEPYEKSHRKGGRGL